MKEALPEAHHNYLTPSVLSSHPNSMIFLGGPIPASFRWYWRQCFTVKVVSASCMADSSRRSGALAIPRDGWCWGTGDRL